MHSIVKSHTRGFLLLLLLAVSSCNVTRPRMSSAPIPGPAAPTQTPSEGAGKASGDTAAEQTVPVKKVPATSETPTNEDFTQEPDQPRATGQSSIATVKEQKSDEAVSALSIDELPILSTDAQTAKVIAEKVDKLIQGKRLVAQFREKAIMRLTKYFQFLGLKFKATAVAKATEADQILSRLLSGSTQFLMCDSMADWECLEKTPIITPSGSRADVDSKNLGAPKKVDNVFRAEALFTRRFHADANMPEQKEDIAEGLARRIREDSTQGLKMAIYGIDDVKGSMAAVYNAILEVGRRGLVKAVFDVVENSGRANKSPRFWDVLTGDAQLKVVSPIKPIIFSYVEPKLAQPELPDTWVFGRPKWMDVVCSQPMAKIINGVAGSKETAIHMLDTKWMQKNCEEAKKNAADADALTEDSVDGLPPSALDSVRMSFQYNGTASLITELNKNATTDSESQARVEWPARDIMHNKFFVMKGSQGSKVWTGTTNVARTCMGTEKNSNMAVYIDSEDVAQIFEGEFQQMFDFTGTVKSKNVVNGQGKEDIPAGRFHGAKKPTRERYIRFMKDGTELRVHFSPLDDGEHRAILPMIHSARSGDIIRISMFGGSGFEFVRAFQAAQARGVSIYIVLDATTGRQPGSWTRDATANILQDNPFMTANDKNAGEMIARYDNWAGLNHHKTATLSRIIGGKEVAVSMIVGSQNWSQGGNDNNDENMVSIRNEKLGLEIGAAFNRHFELQWPLSVDAKEREEADAKKKKDGATVPE